MEFSKLSKAVSHALRHEPWLYELELDEAGWVSINDLIAALQLANPEWPILTQNHISQMISQSEKKRHELNNGQIRALYGHSLPQKLKAELLKPPQILYHGTSPESAKQIKLTGLEPMSRQYVHLSVDTATANEVGKRKSVKPTILSISAASAFAGGVKFYRGNDLVWLADFVPSDFIT